MIQADQPTIFDDKVIARVSSVSDGNMRFGRGDDRVTAHNRQVFLSNVGTAPEHATLVQVSYDNVDRFARYHIVDESSKSEGMLEPQSTLVSDALLTKRPSHALFLPLADCVGVVLHDPVRQVLMLSHVGRHSAEIDGGRLSVEYMVEHTGSQAGNIKVWLSPAVGQATYPIYARDNRGLQDIIVGQLLEAGVPQINIEASPIDTAVDQNYFSHSQYLVGNRQDDGRHAVVAMMV